MSEVRLAHIWDEEGYCTICGRSNLEQYIPRGCKGLSQGAQSPEPATATVSAPKRTFAEIADDLSAYQETLELVESQIVTGGISGFDDPLVINRQELQGHLERIGKELVTKTDACAGVIRRLDSDIDDIKSEKARLTAKQKVAEKALDWLKGYILSSMRENSLTRLKTPLNTISIVKNGGKQSLSVPHPELVPDELCSYTLKRLTRGVLERIKANCHLVIADIDLERIPNNEAIRAELEKNCVDCNGQGNYVPTGAAEWVECLKCQGTGKRKVPGAKLEPRGERLDCR